MNDLRMPRRYVTLEELDDVVVRFPRHRGTPRLRRRLIGSARAHAIRLEEAWP